tara:strand:+ start:1082 stop:1549 length:468 start_codon:yes stop_codon:yes gene_type:complete
MKIKKRDIIKIIESYIFEQEAEVEEDDESPELVSLENFVIEDNQAKIMLNYDKKTIDVTIEKIDLSEKNIKGSDAAAYLNIALVWSYDTKNIKSLLKMCEKMDFIKEDTDVAEILSKLESNRKTQMRSQYINNIFNQKVYRGSKHKAQSIINSLI